MNLRSKDTVQLEAEIAYAGDHSIDSRDDLQSVSELKARLVELLKEARGRTLELMAPLSNDDLVRQHDPLMSPIIWDIGHIANFEEMWGVRSFPGESPIQPEFDVLFDPIVNPRSVRDKLSLPMGEELRVYLSGVRTRLITLLKDADLEQGPNILKHGYLYQMLLQHEYQHNETLLATLQLKLGEPYNPPRRREVPKGNSSIGGMITIPAGEFWMGTDDHSLAYDNERPRHRVYLDEFQIGVAPVTNGEFLEFVEEGGYSSRQYWSDEGWAFITEKQIAAPKHWHFHNDGYWGTRSMDQFERLNPRRPVVHVCWHEALAYCRFVGRRLPTEAEWEKAASWNPETGAQSKFPWGNTAPSENIANLDQLGYIAAEIGAYPTGQSAVGCHQMVGDVWEWTSGDFQPYPGFEAFPYEEYSKVFFGSEYKVLRGGSWATRPGAIRNTFRNWDYPIRRQIFAGFRCAR